MCEPREVGRAVRGVRQRLENRAVKLDAPRGVERLLDGESRQLVTEGYARRRRHEHTGREILVQIGRPRRRTRARAPTHPASGEATETASCERQSVVTQTGGSGEHCTTHRRGDGVTACVEHLADVEGVARRQAVELLRVHFVALRQTFDRDTAESGSTRRRSTLEIAPSSPRTIRSGCVRSSSSSRYVTTTSPGTTSIRRASRRRTSRVASSAQCMSSRNQDGRARRELVANLLEDVARRRGACEERVETRSSRPCPRTGRAVSA